MPCKHLYFPALSLQKTTSPSCAENSFPTLLIALFERRLIYSRYSAYAQIASANGNAKYSTTPAFHHLHFADSQYSLACAFHRFRRHSWLTRENATHFETYTSRRCSASSRKKTCFISQLGIEVRIITTFRRQRRLLQAPFQRRIPPKHFMAL